MPEQLPEPQNPAHQPPETGHIEVPLSPSNFEGIPAPLESESLQADAIAAEINAEVHATVPVESPAYAKERFSGLKKMWRGLKQGVHAVGERFAIVEEGYRFTKRENIKARLIGSAALIIALPQILESRVIERRDPASLIPRAHELGIRYVTQQIKGKREMKRRAGERGGKIDPFTDLRDQPLTPRIRKPDPFG